MTGQHGRRHASLHLEKCGAIGCSARCSGILVVSVHGKSIGTDRNFGTTDSERRTCASRAPQTAPRIQAAALQKKCDFPSSASTFLSFITLKITYSIKDMTVVYRM
jgi:hypothetical protein